METFVIIDGNAILHRSFHAVPMGLRSPEGVPTNAVYGFTSILLGILERERPTYLAVAFDLKGPTFRHVEFADYKATRAKTDDSLVAQFPIAKKLLREFSIPIFEKPGLEADDFLGILSSDLRARHPEIGVIIVTGDKDALQLVGDGVTVVTPVSGYTKVVRYDREAVKEKMGVWPEQVADFKGLSGDPSDNIPGVPGIGEKTAIRLIEEWGSVEGIYEHIESVTPERIRELMRAHADEARMCKRLATIIREDSCACTGVGACADGGVDLEACKMSALDISAVRSIFDELGFKSLLGRLEGLNRGWSRVGGEADGGNVAEQASLF